MYYIEVLEDDFKAKIEKLEESRASKKIDDKRYKEEKNSIITNYLKLALGSLQYEYNKNYSGKITQRKTEILHCNLNYNLLREIMNLLKSQTNADDIEIRLLSQIMKKANLRTEKLGQETNAKVHEQNQTYWRIIQNLDCNLIMDVIDLWRNNKDIIWENLAIQIYEKLIFSKRQTR